MDNQQFINLSNEEKINFFNSIDDNQKKEVIKNLDNKDIISFMNLFSNKDKVELLKYFDIQKLKDYHEFLKQNNTINQTKIDTDYQNITTSKESINQSKIAISENKKEIKSLNKKIKKVDKERKHQLTKLLKLTKPSPFNKVRIISKYKTKKLLEKLEDFKEINQSFENLTTLKSDAEVNINLARENIQKEKENIQNYQTEIHESIETIKRNEARMKQIDAIAKQKLKEQLKGKKVNPNSRVNTKRKKKNTYKKMEEAYNFIDSLHKKGIMVYIAEEPLPHQKNPNLLENPIASITNDQIKLLMQAVNNYHNNNKVKTQAPVRQRVINGFANFTFVVIITTLIIIGSLFLGAFIIK